jgi:hypothetical protein
MPALLSEGSIGDERIAHWGRRSAREGWSDHAVVCVGGVTAPARDCVPGKAV